MARGSGEGSEPGIRPEMVARAFEGKEADFQYRELNRQELRSVFKKLNEGVNQLVQDPQKLREMLRRTAGFYQYSLNNMFWILVQNPAATQVASYNRWKENQRQVRGKEKGLKILMPIRRTVRKKNDKGEWEDVVDINPETGEKTKRYYMDFTVGSTFDVSQTDPMEGYVKTDDGRAQKMHEDLLRTCKKRGISVRVAGEDDNIFNNLTMLANPDMGAYWSAKNKEIVLRPHLNPETAAGHLAHELAHADLGHAGKADGIPTEIKEAQAESVAYALCAEYGIERNMSFEYLASWAQGNEDTVHSVFADIHESTRRIMNDINGYDPEAAAEKRAAAYKAKRKAASAKKRKTSQAKTTKKTTKKETKA